VKLPTSLFVADEFVAGSNCTSVGLPLSFTGNAACPVPPLQVFGTKRTGNTGNGVGFTYTIPNLAPGQAYQVCLYFMDDLNGTAGKRVFGVNLNGAPALTNFDIAGTAGGVEAECPKRDRCSVQLRLRWEYRHGWRTPGGLKTSTHPVVSEKAREMLDKESKELSGVLSTAKTRSRSTAIRLWCGTQRPAISPSMT
jgi:hypothetical protein